MPGASGRSDHATPKDGGPLRCCNNSDSPCNTAYPRTVRGEDPDRERKIDFLSANAEIGGWPARLFRGRKGNFLRALWRAKLRGESLTYKGGAAEAEIPWGTVASWLHRDSELRELAASIKTPTPNPYADWPDALYQAFITVAFDEDLYTEAIAVLRQGATPSSRFLEAIGPEAARLLELPESA